MKTVWVTGASSGLGYYTARALQRAGYAVVAGARSFAGNEGESDAGWRLPLDVKDEASCDAFCRAAREKYGEPWALVNAAGVLTLGACEEYTAEELRDVMDTNFFGGGRRAHRQFFVDQRAAGHSVSGRVCGEQARH